MTGIKRLSRALKPLIGCWALLLPLACADFGKIRPLPIQAGGIDEFIQSRFDDLSASYCGDSSAPTAILFDIKSTPRLGGKGWVSIFGKEQLLQMASAMRRAYRGWGLAATGPRLSEILDGNGRVIGYLYSPVTYTPVRPEGEDYRVDTITRQDIVEKANPNIRGAGG